MALSPNAPFQLETLPEDMRVLRQALSATLKGIQDPPKIRSEQRILNLACGRADETGVLADTFGAEAGKLEIVGADIRSAEIEEARLRWKTPAYGDIHTRFHVEDGNRFLDAMSPNEKFDLTFMRHQNFWNDPRLWTRMFEGGLQQLSDDGLFVITSYFDLEHQLACQKMATLGATKVADLRNMDSRNLSDAPGKSVDRHIAVFRKSLSRA